MPEVTPQQETAKVVLKKYIELANSSPQALSDDQILNGIPELRSLYGSNTSPAISALRNYDAQLQNTPQDQIGALNQSFISSAGQSFLTQQPTQDVQQQPTQTSQSTTQQTPQNDPARQLLKTYIEKRNASPQDLSDEQIKQELISNGIVSGHDEIIGQLRAYDQELQNTPDDQIGALNQTYLTSIDGVLKKKEPTSVTPQVQQGTTSETVLPTSSPEAENLQQPLGSVGSTLGLAGTESVSQIEPINQPQIQQTQQPQQTALGPYKGGLGVKPETQSPYSRQEGQIDERSELKKFAPINDLVESLTEKTKYLEVKDANTENLLLNESDGLPLGAGDQFKNQRRKAETQGLEFQEMNKEFELKNEQSFDAKLSSMLGLPDDVVQQKKEEWAYQSKVSGQGLDAGFTQEELAIRDKYANNYIRKKSDQIRDEYLNELSSQLGEKAPEYWKKKREEIGVSYLTENDLAVYDLRKKITGLESLEKRTPEQEIELKKLKENLQTLKDEMMAGKDLFREDGSFRVNRKINISNQEVFTDKVNKYAAIYDGTDKATLEKELDNAFFQYVYAKRQYDEAVSNYENIHGEGSYNYLENTNWMNISNDEVEKIKKQESYMEDRLSYFMGINRALLLNEDPGSLGDDGFFRGAIEGLKEMAGVESQSLSALRDNAIQGIQAAGFELTSDQEAKIGQDFTEKLGRSIGASILPMVKIGVNLFAINKVASVMQIPKLAQTIAQGNKTKEFLLNLAYDTATQSAAFALSGESGFSGAGEGIGQAIGTGILGRFGVTNRLANIGVRLATGTATETLSEYAGEFIDEAQKNGWDFQKASENTFGKTAEEGIEKLALIITSAAILGGPGSVLGSGNGNENSFLFATEGMKEVQKSDSDSPIVKHAQENDFTIPPTEEEIKRKDEILAKKSSGETVTEEELNEATLTETKEEFQKTKDIPADNIAPVISKTEGSDTEYKFNELGEEGFISEKELLSKLDDQDFVQKVSSGEIGLNIINPSEEVESKIIEKFPEKPATGGDVQAQEEVRTDGKRTVINGKKLPMAVEHNWSSGKDVKVETSDDAVNFADENSESIINDYLSNNEKGKNGIIDPDAVREYFAETGYDGKNVPTFVQASNKLTEAIFQRILKESPNKKITFLTGVGGSGKTRATKGKLDTTGRNVYDSAFNYFEDLDKKINEAKSAGFEIEVAPVYNDAKTAWNNTIKRGKEGGRFLSLEYFLNSFIQNTGKLSKILEKHKDVTISPIDNSGNNSKKVSLDESLEWDYRITDEQVVELLKTIANDTKLSPEQLASIGSGIRGIRKITSEWTSEMEGLVAGIEERIEQKTQQKSEGSREANVGDKKQTGQSGRGERLKTKEDETKSETETKTSPEAGVLESKDKKIKEASKKLAEKIRSGKIKISLDKFSTSPKPIIDAVINSALEAVALTIEANGTIAQAVADGMRVIQNSEWFKSLTEEKKEEVQDQIAQQLTDQLEAESEIEFETEYKKQSPDKKTEEKAEKKERKSAEKNRQSKAAFRHAKTISDPEKKKEILDKTKYQKFNPETVSKQIDSLYEEVGYQGAIDFVSDPKNKVSLEFKNSVLLDASVKMISEGRKIGDTELINRGESLFMKMSLEGTKRGQANAYMAEIYKRNPEFFWRKKIYETTGKSQEEALDQDYGGKTAREAIEDVRKEMQAEIDGLNETIEKITAEFSEKLKQEKTRKKDFEEKIEKKQKSADDQIKSGANKIRQSLKGKGGTANAGIDPLLLEGIIDVITGYIKKGTLSSAKIIGRVYFMVKDAGGKISRDNIKNIAESIDEFASLKRKEQIQEFYNKVKEILNTKEEITASTINKMVENPESLWEQYQQNILSKIRTKITSIGEGDPKQKAELEKLSQKISKEINAKISEISGRSKKRTGEKASAKDTMIDLMSNADKIQELYIKILNEKDVSVETKNAITSLIESEVVFSRGLVDNLINEELKNNSKKINDIIADHYSGKHQFATTLAETLVREAGLSGVEAEFLAGEIEEKMLGIIEEKAKKALTKFLAKTIDSEAIREAIESNNITPEIQKEINKRLKTKENNKLINKVTKAINLGALQSPQFIQAFSDKFGFRDISPSEQAKIDYLISEIAKLRSPQETTKIVDGKTINTFQREKVYALEKEMNTLIDTLKPKNFAWFAENWLAAQFISVLGGVSTAVNSTVGIVNGVFFEGLAFGMRNILSLRGLLIGMKNGFGAFKAASSRAALGRKSHIVELGGSGYAQDTEGQVTGATDSKFTDVEKTMIDGVWNAIKNIKISDNKSKAILNFISSVWLQQNKLYSLLSASDAFVSTMVSQMIATTQTYNTIAKELNLGILETFTGIEKVKRSGMSDISFIERVQEAMGQDKASKDAFNAIAENEFIQMKNDLIIEYSEKGYKGRELEKKVATELRKKVGGVRMFENVESAYKSRRIQELKENKNMDRVKYAVGMTKDWLMIGDPDGIVGMGAKKFSGKTTINRSDNFIDASLKLIGLSILKFPRLSANSLNKIKTSTPFIGAIDAFVGIARDPKTGEFKNDKLSDFFTGKYKVDKERAFQRLMVNTLTTVVLFTLFKEMFEWDDEDEDWRLKPDRIFDVFGAGSWSMKDNQRKYEDFKTLSFSFEKDQDGRFTNYYRTNLSPQFQVFVSFLSAFSDDERGLGNEKSIQNRSGSTIKKLTKGAFDNTFQAWLDGSFNSIGRYSKVTQYEETGLEKLFAVLMQMGTDVVKPPLQPAMTRDVTNMVYKQSGAQQKKISSFTDSFIRGFYGADYFLEEKTDLFGNTYPTEDVYDRWIGGVQKMSEKHPEVGLLYKFEGGLEIAKWNPSNMKKHGVFSVGGMKYQSKSDEVSDIIVNRQQEIFKEMVTEDLVFLQNIDTKDELNIYLKKYQEVSKQQAKYDLFEQLEKDGLIVPVNN